MKILKIGIILSMIVIYFLARVNHFITPLTYIKLIPAYFPFPETLNYLAGFFEIIFSIFLIPIKTRKFARWGIIFMLIAFIPVHIFMIQKANTDPLTLGKHTITPLLAWARIPIQLILMLWAYWCSKLKIKII